jgi:hypothetical protein
MILNLLSKNGIINYIEFSANVVIKEFIIPGENNQNNISVPNSDIIKNPESEDNKEVIKMPKKNILLSGSNYQNIIPNVGVRILEENKSKNGGLDFKNQFGRMSMKEYELLRKKYTNNYESNHHNMNNFNINENNDTYNYYTNKDKNELKEENVIKRAHTYDINNDINKSSQEIPNKDSNIIYNNIYDRINDNHIHNNGLKYYDWEEKESKNSLINNGNKIINENLFKKNNNKRKHSLYGKYSSDKTIKTNKDINFFNNQILQNKNWGNDNDINKYRADRRSLTNNIRKSEFINMRTRKKI